VNSKLSNVKSQAGNFASRAGSVPEDIRSTIAARLPQVCAQWHT
jgi:hypothetical protein